MAKVFTESIAERALLYGIYVISAVIVLLLTCLIVVRRKKHRQQQKILKKQRLYEAVVEAKQEFSATLESDKIMQPTGNEPSTSRG